MTHPDRRRSASRIYFGILISAIIVVGGVVGTVLLNDWVYTLQSEQIDDTISSPRTGMQILNDYTCMKAETKKVIIKGVEDNYAASNDAPIPFGSVHEYLKNKMGKRGAVTIDRQYDEGGMDKFLLDTLSIPTRTAHGLIIIKTRSLTERVNDTLNIGEMSTRFETRNNYSARLLNIGQTEPWAKEGEVISAQFGDLLLKDGYFENGEMIPRDYESVLGFIQKGPEEQRPVDVFIGDDHIVDFIGAAICQRPEDKRGMTFLVSPFESVDNTLNLSCVTESNEDHCNPYAGNRLCSTALPMACFKPTGKEAPQELEGTSASHLWARGTVRFSSPVKADRFKDQDEAHAYCKSSFGEGYRMATHHQNNSPQLGFIAEGESDVKEAWIHASTEPYGNCWDLKTEYGTGAP